MKCSIYLLQSAISKLFAKKLRVRMAELNISATGLSEKINVSRNTINYCRSGKARMIKFETISELCKGLYIQPDYFFKEK